jgi:hypothetical protein
MKTWKVYVDTFLPTGGTTLHVIAISTRRDFCKVASDL